MIFHDRKKSKEVTVSLSKFDSEKKYPCLFFLSYLIRVQN